jgi:hypothetical protein
MNSVLNQLAISSSELQAIGVDPSTWAFMDAYQRARTASIVLRGRTSLEAKAAAGLLDGNNQNALMKLQLIHGKLPSLA